MNNTVGGFKTQILLYVFCSFSIDINMFSAYTICIFSIISVTKTLHPSALATRSSFRTQCGPPVKKFAYPWASHYLAGTKSRSNTL